MSEYPKILSGNSAYRLTQTGENSYEFHAISHPDEPWDCKTHVSSQMGDDGKPTSLYVASVVLKRESPG